MHTIFESISTNTSILISLSIILFSGFVVTRLTKLVKLPNVSGFIIAGILIGPSVLHMVPESIIENMGFMSDLALAFIAFDVGKFFKRKVLKETGAKVVVITLFESLAAGILVTVTMKYLFAIDWDFAMLLGAIATATAPASTMMTINQYHARGPFVNTLLQVVALDDVVCLLVFTVVTSFVTSTRASSVSPVQILMPIFYNVLALLLGFACALILKRLLASPERSTENRLILSVSMLLGISGLCSLVNVSPLLSCMLFGTVYINTAKDKELFEEINSFTPPIMSIFFILSGMNLNIATLGSVGAIGIGYFILRIIGKYVGSYLGCTVVGAEKNITNYLGVALIPQAGVAIGLAFLGQRMLSSDIGDLLLTVILSSSVLYEIIGPASAKMALKLSGAIDPEVFKVVNSKKYTKEAEKIAAPVTQK